MNVLTTKARTASALGIPNLVRAFGYRLSIKFGINPVRRIQAQLPIGEFFKEAAKSSGDPQLILPRRKGTASGKLPPDWHKNPFNGMIVQNPNRPWWQIPDFDPQLGDIKTIWEASRFDWVLYFAQQAIQGDQAALGKLNHWLANWCEHNQAYQGPNWKCGQEISIRVMHLAMATLLLQQHQKPSESLKTLIKAHLQRIAPTLQYAIAQDNNHGTSESAALFIGGSWLDLLNDDAGEKWRRLGLKWLENRAKRLIETDGSFSQYSVNYHRVMLDTYSMAEHWRKCLNLPKFSAQLYQQLQRATDWLYQMTQLETGDAPNLGANDGARLLPLSDTNYRDFRPSIQLAMALFCDRCAYSGKGEWNTPLQWLGIPVPQTIAEPPHSNHFASGGYSLMRQGKHFALLRFPNFRFRPSQADALHVDLWSNGQNLLRDAGTYSYNAGDDITHYFGGTSSHNTVQFDERDQMPRLSRFLFGEWLKASDIMPVHEKNDAVSATAGYRDYQGAFHHRIVTLSTKTLKVKDTVSGFKHKAVLRWRLQPGDWILDKSGASNGDYRISLESSVPIVRMEITQGWESLYYLQKTSLPVLEIEIHQSGELTTEYHFNP